jgi:putative flippase GtrA
MNGAPEQMASGGQWWRQFVAFAGVGVIATAIQYAVLLFAVPFLHANAVLASSAGFLISAGFNYWLNYHWTFRSSNSHVVAVTRFAIIAAVGFVLNAALMYLLVQRLGVPYVIAQVLTSAGVMLWSYAGSALWTFAKTDVRP